MKCPQCGAENVEGKKFCAHCGSMTDTHLEAFVRSQVRECVREHLRDQKFVEVETTEAIAARFQKWGKLFLVPATILLTLLAVILALFGVSDFLDFRKRVRQASDQTIEDAETAKKQTLDAISQKLSGMDPIIKEKMRKAGKGIDDRMAQLDRSIQGAKAQIADQQAKLAKNSEVLASLFRPDLRAKEKFQVVDLFSGRTLQAVLTATNTGNQDATRVAAFLTTAFVDAHEDSLEVVNRLAATVQDRVKTNEPTLTGQRIPQDKSLLVSVGGPVLSEADVIKLKSGTYTLYIAGVVYYHGAGRGSHFYRFYCAHTASNSGVFEACNGRFGSDDFPPPIDFYHER
jgi:hypothetical protein